MPKLPSFDFSLDKFNQNDDRTFALLFREYYAHLVSIARYYLRDEHAAEDIVMDVFTRLLEKTDNHFESLSQVRGTLVIATTNRCLTYIKRNRLRPYDPVYLQDTDAHADGWFIFRKDVMGAIYSIIDKMPRRRREVMELRANEELTFQQIADKLNISVSTVQGHIEAGRKEIEEKLQSDTWNFYWVLLFLFFLLGIFLKN